MEGGRLSCGVLWGRLGGRMTGWRIPHSFTRGWDNGGGWRKNELFFGRWKASLAGMNGTDPPDHLPAFRNYGEAVAMAKQSGDAFYVIAFLLEAWLGDASDAALAEYAERKGKDRRLQTGRAWESWQQLFGKAREDELPGILECIGRYSNCDAPESELVGRALHLMRLEDELGEPVSISARRKAAEEKSMDFKMCLKHLRYWFQRFAEWQEALAHWQAHWVAHMAPLALQASPERRELVQLGLIQRNFADLNPHDKDWWQFRHEELAAQHQGDKALGLIGKAQSNEKWGALKRTQVDELVIHWWPLLLRHGWTDRDVRLLLREVVDRPEEYPLQEDRELADYRQKALGLKKNNARQDKSAPDGRPRGWRVALAMVDRAGADSSESK